MTRWAVLGYGYLATILLLILTGLLYLHHRGGWGALWSLPGIALLLFGYLILQALWLRLPPPAGAVLTPSEAPVLFQALSRLGAALETPVPDEVRVGDDLNAAVTERRRLPLIGRRQTVLHLGLPLLEAMPADEFEAILAHELAHLSRRHHRVILLVARLQSAWVSLAYGLEIGGHWGAFLLGPFYRWFLPRFESRFLAVSREREFESDALAAQVTGPAVMGRALFRLGLLAGWLEARGWPQLRGASMTRPTPPDDLLARLGEALRRGPEVGAGPGRVARALGRRTLDDHTHPSLAERLQQLGTAPEAAAPTAPNLFPAAEPIALSAFVAPHRVASLRQEVTASWIQEHDKDWALYHEWWRQWEEARAAAEASGREVDADAWATRARWAQACSAPEEAAPILDAAVRRNPDSLQLQLLYGATLLELEDPGRQAAGLALLELVATRDTLLALPAVELLAARAAEAGDAEGVAAWRARGEAIRGSHISAMRESLVVDASVSMETVVLPEAEFRALQRAVEEEPAIRAAYLVRRVTRHYQDQVVLLLLIEADVKWYQPEKGGASAKAVGRLVKSAPFPPGTRGVIAVLERRGRLRRRLRKLPGSLLFRRGETVDPATAIVASQSFLTKVLPSWVPMSRYLLPVLIVAFSVWLSSTSRPTHPHVLSGSLPRTLPELRRVVADSPGRPGPVLQLADAYYDVHRLPAAESSYALGVTLDSTNSAAWRRLGWVRYSLHRPEEAIPALERSIALADTNYYAHYDLGLARAELGQWAAADSSFQAAERIDSTSGYPAVQRARALTALRRYDEARVEAAIAERLRPTDPDVWGVAAWLEVSSQHAADAYAPAHHAMELAGDNPKVLAFFGRVAYVNSRYDEALDAYHRALALDSSLVRGNPADQEVLQAIEAETGRRP